MPTRRPDHRQDDASTREGEPAAGLTPPQGASAQILALQSSFGNAAVARAIAAGQLGVAREGAGAVDAAWGYEAGEASEDRGEAENEDPEARLARAVAARIAEKGKAAEKPPAPPAWGYTAASEEGEQESAPPAWGYTPASEEGEQESAPPAWGYTPASEEGDSEDQAAAPLYEPYNVSEDQAASHYEPYVVSEDQADQAASHYEPYNVSEDQADQAPLYEPYVVSEDQAPLYEPYVVSEDQAPLYEPYVGSEDQASEPASAGPAGPAPAAAPPTMMSKAKRALKALGKPFTALGAAIKSAFKGMRGQKKGATPTPAEQLGDPGAAAPGKYYGSPYSPYGAGEKAGPHPLAGGMSEISAASAPAAKKYANLAPMLISPAEKDSSADFLNDGLLASNSLALDMFRHGLAQRSEIAALQKDPDRVREGLKRVWGWSDEDVLKYYDASSNKAKGTKVDYIASEQDLKKFVVRAGATLQYGDPPQPFDTSGMLSKASGPGFAIFVMDAQGNIYAGQHRVGLFHHSSFLAGRAVAAAGEMKVSGGTLVELTSKSGHYNPDTEQTHQMLQELAGAGVALAGVRIKLWLPVPGRQPETKFYDAADFLANKLQATSTGGGHMLQ